MHMQYREGVQNGQGDEDDSYRLREETNDGN